MTTPAQAQMQDALKALEALAGQLRSGGPDLPPGLPLAFPRRPRLGLLVNGMVFGAGQFVALAAGLLAGRALGLW